MAPATPRSWPRPASAGCQVLDGLPMLVAQAERQFEWWTGRRPRAGLMESAAREALAQATE